jgi:hypothetical protein
VLHGKRRSPIKDAFLPRHFGNQHHASEKEINVKTFANTGQSVHQGQKAERH